MSTQTYLFYDLETTGLNKCFDQVIQFAAIRTDMRLNELSRHEINIRLNPDVIPSPYALITHRIGLAQIQHGINEFSAIEQIHELLNKPGTISVGYNTLGFDDEFLRFSFYRNLLAPYTHQFANGCSRMDIYPITLMYFLFKPDSLQWPSINNKVSLKLEHLNQANQFAQGRAHNAMVDVVVTLELARQLHKEQKMWDYVTGFFNKKIDAERLNKLTSLQPTQQLLEALLINGNIGIDLQFQAPVVGIGQHHHYKNQSLWLRLDNIDLQNCQANNIAETTLVMRKRLGEQPLLIPAETRYLTRLTEERKAIATANKQWLQDNPKLFRLICDYHQHYKYPKIDNLDIDAALYEVGFANQHEEQLFQQFHHAALKDKEAIALQIHNPTRREQALRILARHFPEHISKENKMLFGDYLTSLQDNQNTPLDYRNKPHLSAQQAMQECKELREQADMDKEQIALLKELENYLHTQHLEQ